MKLLWLCNVPLPVIAQEIGLSSGYGGGWLVSLADTISKIEDIDFYFCFPVARGKQILQGKINGINYFGFPQDIPDPTKYNSKIEGHLESFIDKISPDIIHVWGTEYPHALSIVNVCEKLNILEKVVISIQGLCSACAKHYYAALPTTIIKEYSFRDLIRMDNIKQQRNKFFKRGYFEIKALGKVKHVIGRTTWDKACTLHINSELKYHFCNETLREEFYRNKWDIEKCEKYSIFVSQGNYPIKGLHLMLEAMPEVLKRFPKAHLYIAGHDITDISNIRSKLSISTYGLYIRKMINSMNLQTNVTFTGPLTEKQMCERFLKSHVFVSPSSIENSPNSVGEAMLLGLPTVSSNVGGVSDMLSHKLEGFTYPYDEPYMLAYYINEIFEDSNLARNLSNNAIKHATITHNKENNLNNLLRIYRELIV